MSREINAISKDEAIVEFKKKLRIAKLNLTNFEKFLNKKDPNNNELRNRCNSIETVFENFNCLIQSLLEKIDDEIEIDALQVTINEFTDRYFSLIGEAYDILKKNDDIKDNVSEKSNDTILENKKNSIQQQSVKLPEVRIPFFDGNDPTEWITFRDTFMALIHNNHLIDETVKFTYLLDKLKGNARAAIGHITLTKAGYEEAWQILINLYDDIRVIIDKHVEALLDIEKITKRNESNIRKLLNESVSHISSLNACGHKLTDLSEIIILKIIVRKLDTLTRGEWEELSNNSEKTSWKMLKEFLERKCRVLHEIEKTTTNNIIQSKPQGKILRSNGTKSTNSFFVNNYKKKLTSSKCDLCGTSKHPYFMCSVFNNYTPQERFKTIREKGACINCLNPSHKTFDCKSNGCKICRKIHHTLLHFDQPNPEVVNTNKSTNQTNTPIESKQETIASSELCQSNNFYCNTLSKRQIILPTVLLKLENHTGKKFVCRALLDTGSQSNFISEKLFNKLQINCTNHTPVTVTGINGSKTQISNSVNLTTHSNYMNFSVKLKFFITKLISHKLPHNNIDISRWQIPSHIRLADPNFNLASSIDIILGAEIFPEIFMDNKIQLNSTLPYFQESIFGWVVIGKLDEEIAYNFSCLQIPDENSKETDLERTIIKFWEVENLPIKKPLSEEETLCENYFLKTTTRSDTGQYIVSIPFRKQLNEIGDSKTQALKRFHNMECKLKRNPELKMEYVKFINEYHELGHMTLVDNETGSLTYYMPHHAVLRPHSTSTKIRVVFDASAKTSTNTSLNEMMLVGPVIQDNLFEIILRFRKHKFAMTCDIAKMYRQILVDKNQTGLQRILWRENENEPLLTFELTTVTYGTAAAPYLATRVLKQLIIDEGFKFPLASKVANNDFYVDDLITGCDDLDQAVLLQNEIINLLNSGQFHLHKWCANDAQLLNKIPIQDQEKLEFNDFSFGDCVKALGLYWQPKEDIFIFKLPAFSNKTNLTKRLLISDIAKLYDPMGLLAPIIIIGKILIQSLWNLKIGWDEYIPDDITNIWLKYKEELKILSQISIKRNVIGHDFLANIKKIELHGFSDASEKAYGACLYIKTTDESNNISVRLLCSKSRVAPIKTLSLPRLELAAALLLSQLVTSAVEALHIEFHDVILWSDSTITLFWIVTSPHKLKNFVANRVTKIQEMTKNMTWKHIDSLNNPADLISRGVMPNKLKDLEIWWNGPDILKNTEYNSIIVENIKDLDSEIFEFKPEKTFNFLSSIDSDIVDKIIEKHESFIKCIRIMAFVMRFCKRLKHTNEQRQEFLTINEIETAHNFIVRSIQNKSFHTEIQFLKNGKPISSKSNIRSLNPFLDKNGILRVGGRLVHSNELNYNYKHQILIPAKHIFTNSLFIYEHKKNFHAGPSLLLSLVRQKYWPINGINIAKQTFRKCVSCFRNKPKTSQQIMGNLPIERIETVKAFYNTGVDFCGPFFIKLNNIRKGTLYKMYVASYVCMCTKAVHLEIVHDLTTNSFLNSFKRFLARRGTVSTIWSDNASTFQGAKNQITEMHRLLNNSTEKGKINDFCLTNHIDWKFIPPRSPNFGGLWEASIKSFKTHLKRVTKNQTLTLEEFHTITVQIENILNSRPITIMSNDPNDMEALTPSHFLTGGPAFNVSEPSYAHISENKLTKWQKLSSMVESFWRRFSMEYLHKLQARAKWNHNTDNIVVGDVVLLIQDNLPPTKWPLSIVVSVTPGIDNKVRVVEVQTTIDGIKRNFKRSISKICKLPIFT